MSNRKWIFKFVAALLFMLVGLSAYAADNNTNLLTSNTPSLLTSTANTATTLTSSAASTLLSSSNSNLLTSNNLTAENNDDSSSTSDAPIDLTDSQNVYKDIPNDYSMKYLNMLFGNMGTTLHGSITGQTVGMLFKIFNQGILIACGIWVLLTLWRIVGKLLDGNVQEISKEGKTFLSICLGICLVIPSPTTGYSTIQNIIMKVVVQGVKLANGIWSYQIDAFEHHRHVYDNPPQQELWMTSDSEGGQAEYTYNKIMTDTVPTKVNTPLFSILKEEVKYYQSAISCQSQGSESCGTPNPLIAVNSSYASNDTNTNVSKLVINTSYPEGDANPVTFTASLDLKDITPAKAKIAENYTFTPALESAASNLSSTALDIACTESNSDVTLCENTASLNYNTAALVVMAESSRLTTEINNTYGLQRLADDPLRHGESIKEGGQCMAKWLSADELSHRYEGKDWDKYRKKMKEWEAQQREYQERVAAISSNSDYQRYSQGVYADNYRQCAVSDIGKSGTKTNTEGNCHYDSSHFMKVGTVGSWGGNDYAWSTYAQSDDDSVKRSLNKCVENLEKNDRLGFRRQDDLFKDKNLSDNDYKDKLTEICNTYGSILLQVARPNDSTVGTCNKVKIGDHDEFQCEAGGDLQYGAKSTLDNDSKKQLLDAVQQNIADGYYKKEQMDLPKRPEMNITTDDEHPAVTCTQALAQRMRDSGWIMAGAYYWLIAHQDQKVASTSETTAANYIDWSVGKKMYTALMAFSLINNDGNNDGGGSSAIIDKLKETVKDRTAAEFATSGANIGQIDTYNTGSGGIISQLAWAGSAFKSVISGETNSIDAAPESPGVAGENNTYKNKLEENAPSASNMFFDMEAGLFPQLTNQVYYLQRFILNVAKQLNNPNIDPQSIIASVGMGMIYQGGYATLGYIHMMITLVITVLIGVFIIAGLMMIPFAGGSLAAIVGAPLAMMVSFAKIMGSMLRKIGTTFLAMGAIMAFYVPIYPWIVFTFAAVGWFIAVIEAMAAGPLICLGMTHPQGQELASSLKQSVMLLLSVFIRPALMIIAFIMSMILARVLLFFMIQGFLMLLGTLFNDNANDYCRYIFNTAQATVDNPEPQAECDGSIGTSINLWSGMFNLSSHAADIAHIQYQDTINDASNPANAMNMEDPFDSIIPDGSKPNTVLDGRPGPGRYRGVMQFIMMMVSMPVMLGILTYMTYKIINHAYSLVFLVPENVLKWIGAQSAGNTQQLMSSAEASKDLASRGAKAGGKGTDKAMQAGEAQASAPMKAGAGAAMQAGNEGAKGASKYAAAKNKK